MAAFVASSAIPALATSAHADAEGTTADSIQVTEAAILAAIGPGTVDATPLLNQTTNASSQRSTNGGEPLADGVEIASETTGQRISIDLPSDAGQFVETASDGLLVQSEPESDATLAVRHLSDGDTQLLSVLETADAPREYAYAFDLADDDQMELMEDGSVEIFGLDGNAYASIAPPWAKDANGASVPTWYELNGTVVVQHVDPSETAVYPIVADPEVSWGWVSGTVYFNRSETRNMRDAAQVTAFAGAPCLGLAWTGVALGVCVAFAISVFSIAIAATRAYEEGGCVKVKYPVPIAGRAQGFGERGCY